jgi:PKD repeat protein
MEKDFNNYRLDNKVILTSLILCAFFLVLIGFRLTSHEKCPIVDFSYKTESTSLEAFEKEEIRFSSTGIRANDWEWNFGDNTPVDRKSGGYATHIYAKAGVYTVRLTVNGKCDQVRNIHIDEKQRKKPTWYARPSWPAEPLIAGQRYYFSDSTSEAKDWLWAFDGDVRTLRGRTVQKVFSESGVYNVILVIKNGEESETIEKKFIVTLPAPAISVPRPITNNGNNNNNGQGNRNVYEPIPVNPTPIQGEVVVPVPAPDNLLKKAPSIPELNDRDLKGYILDIDNGGVADMKSYFKNGDIKNCIIYFNEKKVSLSDLKENIAYHTNRTKKNVPYGKSLNIKHEVDDKGYIKVIEITAVLNQPAGLLGGLEKKKVYPH